jgi:chromosome partitioning protein
VVDCDPQGSIADWLGVSPGNTFFDLLTDRVNLQDCIYQARERLNIIPSDKKLALIEVNLAKDKDMEKAFQKKLGSLKGYDFILLDCPPSVSILNLNVLEYADEIFLPVSMDYLSLRGVKQVVESLPEGIKIAKVIPTFYDQRTKKSKEISNDLKSFFKGKITIYETGYEYGWN